MIVRRRSFHHSVFAVLCAFVTTVRFYAIIVRMSSRFGPVTIRTCALLRTIERARNLTLAYLNSDDNPVSVAIRKFGPTGASLGAFHTFSLARKVVQTVDELGSASVAG